MPHPTRPAIASLLAEESETVRQFILLLQREQCLLSEGNVEGLPSLAADKSAFADRLGGIARQRELLLGREGCQRMDAWLAKPENQQHQDTWHQLLDLARQARGLNETNGQLIAIHLRHNQQALAVLMAAADQAMTYGPDGQQRPSGSGRSFGSA